MALDREEIEDFISVLERFHSTRAQLASTILGGETSQHVAQNLHNLARDELLAWLCLPGASDDLVAILQKATVDG